MRLAETLEALHGGPAGDAEAAGLPWLAVGASAARAVRAASGANGRRRPVRRLNDLFRALEILETSSCPGLVVDPKHLATRPEAALRLLDTRVGAERVIVLDRKLPPTLRRLLEQTGARVCRPGRRRGTPPTPAPAPPPAAAPLLRADQVGGPVPAARLDRFARGLLERQPSAPNLMAYILETLAESSGARRVSLMLRDESRGDLVLAYGVGLDAYLLGAARTRLGLGISGTVAEGGTRAAGQGEAGGPRGYAGSRYLVLPLGEEEAATGVVCLTEFPQDCLPPEDEIARLEHAAQLAGRALEVAERLARAESLAGTDQLTGLANRRTFDHVLAREVERAGRTGRALAVVILDLDDFKKVNDDYGHAAGDKVLVETARRLEAAVRDADLVARWGGEEFALVLPATSDVAPDAAADGAERARVALGRRLVSLGAGLDPVRVRASAGIAFYPSNAQTAEALVLAADDALYVAKTTGKDRLARA